MSVDLPGSPANVEALLPSAVSARAAHIRNESGSITLAGVRRLLEEDLGLDKFFLDSQKALIRQLVDEVLVSADSIEALPQKIKKENVEQDSIEPDGDKPLAEVLDKKQSKKVLIRKTKQENEAENLEEEWKSEYSKEQEFHMEAPKKKKRKKESKENAHTSIKVEKVLNEQEDGSHPEVSDERSDVSEDRKSYKALSIKNDDAKSGHNKKVEHLKKLIKACGLNVPPSIYKKAKQVSEGKRDSFLIKELEGILSRQGLSSNASEKEIKAVKRKLERERDLEGIDMTNIIIEPRGRRSTAQVFAPIYKRHSEEQDSEENEEDANSRGNLSDSEGSDD